jgi:hypothetical protein
LVTTEPESFCKAAINNVMVLPVGRVWMKNPLVALLFQRAMPLALGG